MGITILYQQQYQIYEDYDPCFGYELSAIINNGIKEMYLDNKDVFYYLTLMNENYKHLPRPKELKDEDILKGAYKLINKKNPKIKVLASGTLNFAIESASILTSYRLKLMYGRLRVITNFTEMR